MFRKTPNKMSDSIRSRRRREPRKRGRLCSCSGFTLTELIVIIIMVGILAATVGVKYGSYASTNVRMAVNQVVGDLRFLQSRAMASLYSTGPIINVATFPAGANTYNLGGQVKTLPSGVTINSGTLTVTFNSLGEYNAAVNTSLVLKSGSAMGTLTIYAISGDVEAY